MSKNRKRKTATEVEKQLEQNLSQSGDANLVGEQNIKNGAGKQDKSMHVTQRPKISFSLSIKGRDDLTEKQMEIVDVATRRGTKCIFIDGLYGTSKSYLSVYSSLKLLNDKKIDEIIFIRNPVESSTTGKIGFIPGTSEEKMAPYNAILFDKLEEMLPEADINKLKKDNRINCYPVGFVRGRSWNCKAIIVDEASSMTWDDLFLVLTRCGEFTRIFFVGDSVNQNDIGSKSGFRKMFEMFDDEESRAFGIHCFELREYNDIVRSGLLRFVMEKTGLIKKPKPTSELSDRTEPMFPEE